jgi:DnaJ-class molecular chaperone
VKPLAEQDHYEILELARGCSPEEVERAWQLARETWSDDSLAGYSVVGALDASSLRARAETAFRVLSDPEARRAYDAGLSAGAAADVDAPLEAAVVEALQETREPSDLEGFDELDAEPGECDGPRLRRARLRRGVELDDVS